jgi:hypothetical protein
VHRRRSLALYLAASLRRKEQEEDTPGDLHAQHRKESEWSGGPRRREYKRDVVVFLDARGRNVLEHKSFPVRGPALTLPICTLRRSIIPLLAAKTDAELAKPDAELAYRDAVNWLPDIVENKRIVLVFARYARLLRLCMLLIGGWVGGDHDGAELGLPKCSLR